MQTPNKQTAYCVQRKVGNLVFHFFRKDNGYGECVVSKNLRKDYAYDNQGNETIVNDLDYQEIVKELKEQGMVEKGENKSNSSTKSDTVK